MEYVVSVVGTLNKNAYLRNDIIKWAPVAVITCSQVKGQATVEHKEFKSMMNEQLRVQSLAVDFDVNQKDSDVNLEPTVWDELTWTTQHGDGGSPGE